jgi:hypothetical protein
MTQAAIERAYLISLIAGAVIGLVLLVWWMMKVAYPRVLRAQEASRVLSLNATAMRTVFYGLPGIVAFVLCVMPGSYFGHLSKQFDYCRELIRVNDLKRDDPILAERCGGLDRDELFAPAKR